MRRPVAGEYHEYYGRYIDLVPQGDVIAALETQMEETQAILASVPRVREEYRYAPGKWSVREVVGHLIDTERLFAFRCLWIGRGAVGDQPSMDQDAWAEASGAAERPLSELAAEWAAARKDSVLLFRGLSDESWARSGTASGRRIVTRAFPWIIAGHELYHRALLKRDYHLGVDA